MLGLTVKAMLSHQYKLMTSLTSEDGGGGGGGGRKCVCVCVVGGDSHSSHLHKLRFF